MLHVPQYTPTQSDARDQKQQFRQRISEKVEAQKIAEQELISASSDEAQAAQQRMTFLQKEMDRLVEKHAFLSEKIMEVRRVKIEDIQRAVCKFYDISRIDMLSERRTANLVRPRMIAVWLCRKLTKRSLPEIGRRFGHRDHTTILHSARRIEALRAEDSKLDNELNAFINMLSVASASPPGAPDATPQPAP